MVWNRFVELLNRLCHGYLKAGFRGFVARIGLAHHVQKNETRAVFLRQRQSVRSSSRGSSAEIAGEQHAMETPAGMYAAAHVRPNRQHRNWRAVENFFGDGTQEKFCGAGSAMRSQND